MWDAAMSYATNYINMSTWKNMPTTALLFNFYYSVWLFMPDHTQWQMRSNIFLGLWGTAACFVFYFKIINTFFEK